MSNVLFIFKGFVYFITIKTSCWHCLISLNIFKKMAAKAFGTSAAFCSQCGAILPLLTSFGNVECYSCKTEYDPESTQFNNVKFEYTIHFNTISTNTNENILNTDSPEGPVVERKCPKCGNDRMSYATLQLRSADEGQTVFYTCVQCKYKETENS